MYFSNQVQFRTTVKSGAAIEAGARFVKQNTSTGVLELAGNLSKALGVLERTNAPSELDQDTPVAVSGIVEVEAGGAIDYGVPVTSDASGRAIAVAAVSVTVASGSGGGNTTTTVAGGKLPTQINGYAMEKATEAGQFIRVLLA